MKHGMDELLKRALTPDDRPDPWLNQNILHRAEEMTFMKKKKRRNMVAAASVITLGLLLGSTSAYAAWRLLTPKEVAEHHNDTKLAEAFSGEDAVFVNESQEYQGYRITFLGAVAGKDLSDYLAADEQSRLQNDRFYSVVSIEHTDGTPMPDTSDPAYGQEVFLVSPYIRGLDPVWNNIFTMNGGYSAFVENGVEYRLVELDNVEIFADRGLYLGVSSGTFYDNNAYRFDESTGEITRNEAYGGVNALFTLPLDPAKGDPAAAAAYLEEMNRQMEEPGEIMFEEEHAKIDAWVNALDLAEIETYCERIEEATMICTPDADGVAEYSYDLGDEGGGSGCCFVNESFPEGTAPGTRCLGGYGWSEDGMEDLTIQVFELNADGTVTFSVYRPTEETIKAVEGS